MSVEKIVHLTDWLTTDELCFASKLTSSNDRVLHDHDFYEIFYITKGKIKYRINDEIIEIKEGDLCFLNLNDIHSFLREEDTECEHRDIVIRPNLFESICAFLSIDSFSNTKEIIEKQANISANTIKEIEDKCSLIDHLSLSDKNSAKIEIKMLLVQLLGYLFDSKLMEPSISSPYWLNELMERFNDVELLKGGISEIIKPFYYSYEHICRAFKARNHITMTEYLNQRRLFEFANMLVHTEYSITELHEMLGINSISYFDKLFKKQYHTTPLKFRKQKEMWHRK